MFGTSVFPELLLRSDKDSVNSRWSGHTSGRALNECRLEKSVDMVTFTRRNYEGFEICNHPVTGAEPLADQVITLGRGWGLSTWHALENG